MVIQRVELGFGSESSQQGDREGQEQKRRREPGHNPVSGAPDIRIRA